MIFAMIGDFDGKFTLDDFLNLSRFQIAAIGFINWFITTFRNKVGNILFAITLDEMHTIVRKKIIEGWFRKTTFDRNDHGLIIFIPILVNHDKDPFDLLKHIKR